MAIVTEQKSRTYYVKRVLWIVLFLNLFVAMAKFSYGLVSHSVAMQADGIHSIFDSAGNVVGLIGITLAMRPADAQHPYGHFKLETYASMIIGIMLLFAAYQIGSNSITALVTHNFHTEVTPISYLVMVITLVINLGVTTYEHIMSRRLKSEIIKADASHTLSDALVSIGVIVGLFLVSLGYESADDIMALVVMVAILFTAFDVFKSAYVTLVDEARLAPDEIRVIVESVDGIHNAHKIRSRGLAGEIYVDLHIMVDPKMTVVDSHRISDHVEAKLKERYPEIQDILIHIEPDDAEHVDLKKEAY